jgi:excisionase family DNA binding protein
MVTVKEYQRKTGEQNMYATDIEQELFSMREVARIFGVSKMTIIRWIKSGDLPIVRIGLGHPRVSRAAIDELIQRNQKCIRESA